MKVAKPCPKCNKYYPGDCYILGCQWNLCLCDGCETYFALKQEEMEREENEN